MKATPLSDLLCKDSHWCWTATEQASFDALGEAVCSGQVLVLPVFTCDFVIETDASANAIGAVLSQD